MMMSKKFKPLADVEQATLPYVARSRSNRYTLDTVYALAAYLDNPQDKLRVVHVAGTSGKTTTSFVSFLK